MNDHCQSMEYLWEYSWVWLFILSIFLPPLASSAELTSKEVVQKSMNLDQGRSVSAKTRIQVFENGEKTRDREMLYRRKWIDGLEHVVVNFNSPADIKGLALLIANQKNGDSDQHLYTPSFRRIRRIRGSLKSQEFADTDFSYEDMERRDVNDSDHELETHEQVGDRPCYKIVSTTKKKVRSQYGKVIAWIDEETFLLRKMEVYGWDGKLLKTLKSVKSDLVSGVWTQLELQMENHSKNRKTNYRVSEIEYDKNLDDHIFTTNSLGQ